MRQLTSIYVKIDEKDKEVRLLSAFPKSQDHLFNFISCSTMDTLEYDYVVGALLYEEVQ